MGLFFSKKRKDGTLVTDGDPMIHIMPYIMRGRNESAVYYCNTVNIEPIQKYIKEKRREGKRITMFNVVVTALLQVLNQRPNLNRFIAGRRLYKHDSFEVLYTVKTDLSDDGLESVAKIQLAEDDNIDSVTENMTETVQSIIDGSEEKWDDKLIRYFSKAPRWLLRSILNVLRWMDFHGILPSFFLDTIPMYSSVFVSHLGSIGGGSLFHHLYEFGTTSVFLTIGKVYEKPIKNRDGSVSWQKSVDLSFTIDERIVDGYYMIKSLNMLDQLLLNPHLLELSPKELKRLRENGTITFGHSNVTYDGDVLSAASNGLDVSDRQDEIGLGFAGDKMSRHV